MVRARRARRHLTEGLAVRGTWYRGAMLYTILIVLAIVALLLFIFGRRSV